MNEKRNTFHPIVCHAYSTCSFAEAVNVKKEEDLYKIVKGFIPENVSLICPDNPKSAGLFQLYDLEPA